LPDGFEKIPQRLTVSLEAVTNLVFTAILFHHVLLMAGNAAQSKLEFCPGP